MALDAHHASLVGALRAHRRAAHQAARRDGAAALLVGNRAAGAVVLRGSTAAMGLRVNRVCRELRLVPDALGVGVSRVSASADVVMVSLPAYARHVVRLAVLAVACHADAVATGFQCVRAAYDVRLAGLGVASPCTWDDWCMRRDGGTCAGAVEPWRDDRVIVYGDCLRR